MFARCIAVCLILYLFFFFIKPSVHFIYITDTHTHTGLSLPNLSVHTDIFWILCKKLAPLRMTEQCWQQRAVDVHHVQMTDSAVVWLRTQWACWNTLSGRPWLPVPQKEPSPKWLRLWDELVDFDTLRLFSFLLLLLVWSNIPAMWLRPEAFSWNFKAHACSGAHFSTTYKTLLFLILCIHIGAASALWICRRDMRGTTQRRPSTQSESHEMCIKCSDWIKISYLKSGLIKNWRQLMALQNIYNKKIYLYIFFIYLFLKYIYFWNIY